MKYYYIDTDISLYQVKNLNQNHKTENVWLISYASHGVHIQNQNNMILSSRLYPVFDIIIPYQPKHIEPEYYEKHKSILAQKRGAGYWLWKPYFILKTLNMMPENDILLYVDSSGIFKRNIANLLNLAKNHNIILFPNFHNNRGYVKKIVIDNMMSGEDLYLDKKQIDASVILLRNNTKTRSIIAQWLEYCQEAELLTDIPGENEYPDFIDHRHDQSILTMLYYKNMDSIYLHDFSTYRASVFDLIRRKNSQVSMYPLTFDLFSEMWTYIKIKFIDKLL